MSNVVARSIFNETVAERSWRNYLTSGIIHAVVIGAAFLITIPAMKVLQEPVREHVTLVAPVIPEYHAKIEPPRVEHVAKLTMPTLPPPVVRDIPARVKPEPKPIAKPIPQPVEPIPMAPQPQILAESKPELTPPPPPKPLVNTGSFEESQRAKAEALHRQVIVGGFGDPRGVRPSEHPQPGPVLMAKVGSFDNPEGGGQTGGGGHLDRGSVKQSGFGSAGAPDGAPGGSGKAIAVHTGNFGDGAADGAAHSSNGTVRSSGFGDAAIAAPQHRPAQTAAASFTPVEILFKPRPSYSEEAKNMHLEGQVSLEVVFQASGAVKVVRIIKGLGHGLDEAAEQAATQVRFKPATRSGAPVDTNATISITFELT